MSSINPDLLLPGMLFTIGGRIPEDPAVVVCYERSRRHGRVECSKSDGATGWEYSIESLSPIPLTPDILREWFGLEPTGWPGRPSFRIDVLDANCILWQAFVSIPEWEVQARTDEMETLEADPVEISPRMANVNQFQSWCAGNGFPHRVSWDKIKGATP